MGKAQVGVSHLRNHISEFVARVQAGESFVITRYGRPIAELTPLEQRPLTREQLIARWRHLPTLESSALRKDV